LRIFEILILTPQLLPPAAIGQPFSLQMEARSSSPGYTWTLQPHDCQLNGLSLTTDGLLSGTPSSAGNVGCPIVVTDAQGRRAQPYINPYVVGDAPLSSPLMSAPLSGSASVGSFFSVKARGSGGLPPYSLSADLVSGFPPGVGFDPFLTL